MDNFEYFTYRHNFKTTIKDPDGDADMEEFHKRINQFGCEGWELVNSMLSHNAGGYLRDIICIFKRKITE